MVKGLSFNKDGDWLDCEHCSEKTDWYLEFGWKRLAFCRDCILELTVHGASILGWRIVEEPHDQVPV